MNDIDELLTRGVANIIPGKDELKKLVESKKTLHVYFGIDPTFTKIHLGHTVGLRKLNEFARLGHNVTLVIGDFTALIGDTSDKESERPLLSKQEIEQNFQAYKQQAEKILDFSLENVQVRYNSEWLSKLNFSDIVQLCQRFSVGDFVSRELIRKRLDEGKRVGLHEFLYPVMQAKDSYELKTDVQIGGTDQTFNMQAGRTLIKADEDRESFVLTTPILEGPDGRKMSKTLGNAIWLDDEPNDMYAKVMAINDDLIINYFLLATNSPQDEIQEFKARLKSENPINIKKVLANRIVEEMHGPKPAEEAESTFEKVVQNKELPDDIKPLEINTGDSIKVIDNVVKATIANSRSEAKRLIDQKGIKVDEIIITNPNAELKEGQLLQGKRKVLKIKVVD